MAAGSTRNILRTRGIERVAGDARTRDHRGDSGSYAEEYAATMKPTVPPRNLYEHVLRALNTITRPSTAEEIAEKLNSQLRKGEKPFSVREVAQHLRNMGDSALTLYWLKSRLRRARSS
jgi:hypothetical protein